MTYRVSKPIKRKKKKNKDKTLNNRRQERLE